MYKEQASNLPLGAHAFYQAGHFEKSPISDFSFAYRVPRFECKVCHSQSMESRFAIPQHDPAAVLNREELKVLDPNGPHEAPAELVASYVERMKTKWRLPITAGSSLGPVRIKVTSKPQVDFDVLPLHCGLFARRHAVQRLKERGFPLSFVSVAGSGKYADAADYVQIYTPAVARCVMPSGFTFCEHCLRYSPPESFRTVLYDNPLLHKLGCFATLETGTIMFSAGFLKAASETGTSGLVINDTIVPVGASPNCRGNQ
jgi:hypothetical protein